jgi:hypothetical protein
VALRCEDQLSLQLSVSLYHLLNILGLHLTTW